MQRYLALIALLVFSLPVGLSIAGCSTQVGDYCNGLGYGPKTTTVEAINLQPATTGISLSWGQTGQITQPTATTCKGTAATVAHYTYGSSNLLLADISPTGAICGGTWNRTSTGGIADFTICTPPTGSAAEQCTSTSCGVVQITATGAGVTSNPVPVYIHPPISSVSIPAQAACYSQNATNSPVLSATVLGPNNNQIPSGQTVNGVTQPNYVGTVTYTAVTPSVVTINNTSTTGTGVNGATTPNMPGSTVVNASVAQVSSAAGYFYTCPPASIAININGSTSAVVNPSTPLNINAIIKDTNGVTLNGLTLDYTSTRPQEIAVSSAGQVSATYASAAAINAICQPSTCNPAPVGEIGVLGTGMPVVANTMNVTSTGKASTLLWMASTQSQYFSQVDLTTGVPTSPIRLPYPPNSMVEDQAGANLYFGSYRELMIYSATTNALSKEDTTVPGVVLGVSPDSTTAVINDQLRQVIYLYTVSSGANTSIGGLGTKATFSPDGKNVYIVGPNTLYVHNANTGWSTYSIGATEQSCTLNNNSPLSPPASGAPGYDPFCGADDTLTVPSVAAFISGTPTTAHSFCPNNVANPPYYPPAAIGNASGTDFEKLAGTNDGQHILGANATTFSDIWLYQNSNQTATGVPIGPCPAITGDPLALTTVTNSINFSSVNPGITPSEIDQVVASPDSTVAFVTYSSTAGAGQLPYYQPSVTPGQNGTLGYLRLSGTAASPVSGIFSPDESIFFVGTSGDNLVHYINPATLTDTQTINPGLTNANGQPVPVQMMAVKPRSTT